MKPFGSLLLKLSRLRGRVGVKDRGVLHASAQKPDASAVLQVDGRVENHKKPRLRRSVVAALCVVLALGASVAVTAATERTSPYSVIMQSWNAMIAKVSTPASKPISTPTPLPKPERDVATAPEKPDVPEEPLAAKEPAAPDALAQCGYASIVTKMDKDGETPIYRATFAPGMIDDMASEGCGQFYQGCNVCSISYDECDDAIKAACNDAACLEEKCERKVVCSAKACELRGKPGGKPLGCKSRLTRTACLRKIF